MHLRWGQATTTEADKIIDYTVGNNLQTYKILRFSRFFPNSKPCHFHYFQNRKFIWFITWLRLRWMEGRDILFWSERKIITWSASAWSPSNSRLHQLWAGETSPFSRLHPKVKIWVYLKRMVLNKYAIFYTHHYSMEKFFKIWFSQKDFLKQAVLSYYNRRPIASDLSEEQTAEQLSVINSPLFQNLGTLCYHSSIFQLLSFYLASI